MNIYIENETEETFDFDDLKETIEKAVLTVAEDKNIPEDMDVNVLIVGEDEMREINRENRGVDSVTDVLSFPYFEFDEPGVFEIGEDEDTEDAGNLIFAEEENILGDIIICGKKIKSQAAEYGHSQKRELSFLLVHSMLHLIGYDHIEESDGDIMRAEEKRLMDIIGIGRE